MPVAPQPGFTVTDPALAAVGDALLGIWQPSAPADAESVMFAAAGRHAPAADTTTWAVNLPADPAAARAIVARQAAGAHGAARALGALEAQLAAPAGDDAVFFSTGAPSWLAEAFAEEQRRMEAGGQIEPARRQFAGVVEAAARSITHFAAVETSQGGLLIARTLVGWGGDTSTAVRAGASGEQAALHGQSLLVARRSRALVVQTVLLALQAAAALSTGNPLIALPVIWRTLNALAARARPPG